MEKFIVTKKMNDMTNTESLPLLCKAFGVGAGIVEQVENFDTNIFNSFAKNETVLILTNIIGDSAVISLTTATSDENYTVCSLYPHEEGIYWGWVLEYIRDIIVYTCRERGLNYRVEDYPS